MLDLAAEIDGLLKEVTPEAYQGTNQAKEVVYPYITYSVNTEGPNGNQEEFYIDIQFFDYGTSYARILGLQEELKGKLHKRRIMAPGSYTQYWVGQGIEVPTTNERIKRRDTTVRGKIDWRNKEWQ